jgi:hypothetical protein
VKTKVLLQVATQCPGQRAERQIIRYLCHPSIYRHQNENIQEAKPIPGTEIGDRDELFTIIKYEPYKRNKAALALLWDLDARPHEVTLLKIKHIRLKEKFGEVQIILVDANTSPQKDIKKADFDPLKSLQDAFQEIARNCCKRGC